MAHNLKVVSSNPTSATKITKYINTLKADKNTCVWPAQKRVNAESTFDESPSEALAFLRRASSKALWQHCPMIELRKRPLAQAQRKLTLSGVADLRA
jgi:hypothetical protein